MKFQLNTHILLLLNIKNFRICQKLKINIKVMDLKLVQNPGILSNSILKIFKDVKNLLIEMVPKNFDLIKKVAKYNGTEKT